MRRTFTKRFKAKGEKEKKVYKLEDFQGNGLSWNAKLYGRIPVPKANGVDIAMTAVKEAKAQLKDKSKKKSSQKVIIRVSVKGLETLDEKSRSLLSHNPIHRITAWYPDDSDAEILTIIVKGEGGHTGKANEYNAMVLKSHQGKQILQALRDIMNIVFKQITPEESASAPASRQESKDPSPTKGVTMRSQSESQFTPVEERWACESCTTENRSTANSCIICQTPRNIPTVPDKNRPKNDEFSDYAVPRGTKVPDTVEDDAFFQADFSSPSANVTSEGAKWATGFDGSDKRDYVNLPTATKTIDNDKDNDDDDDDDDDHDYVNLPDRPNSKAQAAPNSAIHGANDNDDDDHDYVNITDDHRSKSAQSGSTEPGGRVAIDDSDADYVNVTANVKLEPVTEEDNVEIDLLKEDFASTNPFSAANPFAAAFDDELEGETSTDDPEGVIDLVTQAKKAPETSNPFNPFL